MSENKYAIIENNIVNDIILAKPEFIIGLNNYVQITDDNIGIGYSYISGEFLVPTQITPQTVINSQNYIQLYDSFLISAAYQKIRSQAIIDLVVTVASTEIISALTDAKYGTPNVPAIQQCINNLLTAATTLDETDFTEIGILFVNSGLNIIYTLPTP